MGDIFDHAVKAWRPQGGLQVPGVAHELPPVHGGVVDALLLVLVAGAVVVGGRRALLTGPS